MPICDADRLGNRMEGVDLRLREQQSTRPIDNADVAQSTVIRKPTASVVGKAQECGLMPSVGALPPYGTTSAKVAVHCV